MLDEDFQHIANIAALVGSRVQLAVAVGSRTALTEAVVAVDIDNPFLIQTPEIEASRLHLATAIDHDRRDAVPREFVTAEQPGWPVADDDHTSIPDDRSGRWSHGLGRLDRANGDDEVKLHTAPTRVDRASPDSPLGQVGRAPSQCARDQPTERLWIGDVVEADLNRYFFTHGVVTSRT
jgi:hypothetical protein